MLVQSFLTITRDPQTFDLTLRGERSGKIFSYFAFIITILFPFAYLIIVLLRNKQEVKNRIKKLFSLKRK